MTHLIPAWVDGTLQPVDKLEVHRRGLRHPAISVFIVDGNRTLLQRRAMGKYHTPGLWANACCTHPHWHEDAADCANRRLREELGIGGLWLDPRDKVEYRADVGGGLTEHELVQIFVGEGCPDLDPNPDEVMDTRWVVLDELPGMIADNPAEFTPWLDIYMRDHAAQIFGAMA